MRRMFAYISLLLLCLCLSGASLQSRQRAILQLMQGGATEDITTGLVLHIQFDGDFTNGYGNDGSFSGGDGSDFVTGLVSGQAWDVDSVGESVAVSPYTAINDLTTMTIAVCVNFDSFGESGVGRIVYKYSGGWALVLESPFSRFRFYADRWTTNSGQWRPAAGTLSTGTNYHLAVTYDFSGGTGENPVMYLDGSDVGSLNELSTPAGSLASDASDTVYVGNDTGGDTFDGRIDDLRVFNVEKTAAQIAAMAALCN